MKNKVHESFEKANADIFDGAVIARSTFGTACMALNLWEALTRENVKHLTVVSGGDEEVSHQLGGPRFLTDPFYSIDGWR